MATVVSKSCFIIRKGTEVRVISPERSKTLTLNLNLVNMAGKMSEEEKGLLDRMLDGLIDNIEDRIDLTIEEMQALVAIRNRSSSYAPQNGTAIASPNKTAIEATNKVIHNGTVARAKVDTVNATERRILGLQKVVDIYAQDFYQLEYDIPTLLQKKGAKKGGVDNPSDWFWLHAMRLTKSCWVFPESSFKHAEVVAWMDDARAKGCKIRVIKYARDQVETIKAIAVEELRETMVEYHTGLIENIANADKDLEAARQEIVKRIEEENLTHLAASAEERESIDYRNNRVRKHLGLAIERLDMAIKSAELFDMNENVADLFDAYRSTIIARAEVFNEMARVRQIKPAPMPK